MTAGKANTEMHPDASDREAVDAAGRRPIDVADGVHRDVRARVGDVDVDLGMLSMIGHRSRLSRAFSQHEEVEALDLLASPWRAAEELQADRKSVV